MAMELCPARPPAVVGKKNPANDDNGKSKKTIIL